MITQERLKELLDYDPNTGIFTRKTGRANGKYKIGGIAGVKTKFGYISIGIGGKSYQAHRLAWLYMTGDWPTHFIDHIDRNKENNKFANLREATNAENMQNNKRRGYIWHRSTQKWMAYIGVNGEQKYLGLFNTEEEARQAYLNAKEKLHPFFQK